MVQITLSSLWSIFLFVGPILLPKLIVFYRSVRNPPPNVPIRPTPPKIKRARGLLALSVCIFLALTLPYFDPPNIFKVTQSRLQTPTDVLFARLAATGHPITPREETLRARFVSLDARLAYLQFGPAVVGDCPFCNSADPATWLYFALPSLLAPHLVHISVLLLATSSVFGPEARRWRLQAMIAGVALAAAELYIVATYDSSYNRRAVQGEALFPLFWYARMVRPVAFCLVQLSLSWFLKLTATNRLFPIPPSVAERLESHSRLLETVGGKIGALVQVRNAVFRDKALMERVEEYWSEEGRVISETQEEREVVESVNRVLERMDVPALEKHAEDYVEQVTKEMFKASKA
ncbi:hypothetical protein M501DRAFT_1055994 [Patellaria atrata CBS 101060]|uniref:Chorismate synthase protein n=1 Tax=Patellaria atrata CBS 101060 TaxID=1346257 RepID=A0A9P4VPB9_9PEZI|nr:hypothetical protein M501DRAFT_1055994 [Patellaria atrata CBS 101060]